MKSYNVSRFVTFTIILFSMMVIVSSIALSRPPNIYAQSTNNDDSTMSTIDDLVKTLVTGVKLENINTIPNQVHVGDTFEVNATVINTLPLNITFIAGNCNSDFSTNLNNIVEEIMTSDIIKHWMLCECGGAELINRNKRPGTLSMDAGRSAPPPNMYARPNL